LLDNNLPPAVQRRIELLKIRHDGYLIHGKPLSPERAARLEELRAKYPKYGPAEPPHIPEHTVYRKGFSVIMHFEPVAANREEAEKMVYHWMWQHGAEITDLLSEKYRCQGLRGVTLVWE
jgi:hypothetical protein